MVTARSPRLRRARSSAGLLHLLGLTLLLLALACAHGTGGSHTTADHATPHHASASGGAPGALPIRPADTAASLPDTPRALMPGPDAARTGTIQTHPAGSHTARTDTAVTEAVAPADTARAITAGAGTAGAEAVAPAAAVVERHDPGHPVHECVPLPPRAAPGADVPAAPAAPVEGCAPAGGPSRSGAAGAALPSGGTAPAPPGGSAVLRV
ncbi:hypothetical protein [Streptomyces sp. NPDC089915]|uniref:hypothetical protein n=1 Tax=Streptomyces sp. NPDC089915 TaxID=3155186 RepID=UPI003423D26E